MVQRTTHKIVKIFSRIRNKTYVNSKNLCQNRRVKRPLGPGKTPPEPTAEMLKNVQGVSGREALPTHAHSRVRPLGSGPVVGTKEDQPAPLPVSIGRPKRPGLPPSSPISSYNPVTRDGPEVPTGGTRGGTVYRPPGTTFWSQHTPPGESLRKGAVRCTCEERQVCRPGPQVVSGPEGDKRPKTGTHARPSDSSRTGTTPPPVLPHDRLHPDPSRTRSPPRFSDRRREGAEWVTQYLLSRCVTLCAPRRVRSRYGVPGTEQTQGTRTTLPRVQSVTHGREYRDVTSHSPGRRDRRVDRQESQPRRDTRTHTTWEGVVPGGNYDP